MNLNPITAIWFALYAGATLVILGCMILRDLL